MSARRAGMGIAAWLMIIALLGAAVSAIDHAIATVGRTDPIAEVAP